MIEPAFDMRAPGAEVLGELRRRATLVAGHPRQRAGHPPHDGRDLAGHVVGVTDGDVARVADEVDRRAGGLRRDDRRPVLGEQCVVDLPVPEAIRVRPPRSSSASTSGRSSATSSSRSSLDTRPVSRSKGPRALAIRELRIVVLRSTVTVVRVPPSSPGPRCCRTWDRTPARRSGRHRRTSRSTASAGSSTPGRWRSSSRRGRRIPTPAPPPTGSAVARVPSG